MASDLIYREDAKDFVRHACHKWLNPVEYLDGVPAADVRPVVRGEWIDYNPEDPNDPRMKCSKCGIVATPLADDVFCQRCGADMRPEGR